MFPLLASYDNTTLQLPDFIIIKIIVVPVMINHYQYNNFYNNDYVIDFY